MPEHRRRQDEDGNTLHERETDNDFWARTANAMDRYKILWLFALAIGGFIGNRLMDPLRQIPVLQAQMIEMRLRQDTATSERREIQRALRILVRMQCFTVSAVDRVKYDVDCSDIPLPRITPRLDRDEG